MLASDQLHLGEAIQEIGDKQHHKGACFSFKSGVWVGFTDWKEMKELTVGIR